MSLHATMRRYDGVTAPIDELIRAGRQLASALSTAPGFVWYAVVDAGGGMLISVNVFDDPTNLAAADQFIAVGSRST